MRKRYIAIAAIAVLLIACALGGWALASTNRDEEPPQQSPSVPTVSPTSKPVLPEFSSASPTPSNASPVPDESETPSPEPTTGETVTKDADGNVTINPNWSTDKIPEDANVVPRQAETNMSGGGGQMTTDKDGVYRGDQPSTAPSTAPSATTAPSTAPSTAPATSSPSGNSSTPKNGQMSEDGTQMWVDGFGWVEMGKGDGGEGGNYYDPDAKLSGEKVGDM